MRSRITIVIAALALGGAIAGMPAFAQNAPGRPVNDGGLVSEPNQAQYSGSGTVVRAPGNEIGANNCAARFHSFDPASGTYLGSDGRRHSCP